MPGRTTTSRIRRLLGTSSIVALGLALAAASPSFATDWTGATSTDWFTAGNWSGGVPTGVTDANIDTVSPNPTVVGATGAQASRLFVGRTATGALTIRNGGAVSDNFGDIGYLAGSTGTATVDGSGSSWTNASFLDVGYLGAGALTIRNGGAVSNSGGTIGDAAGSTGTVTVDGAGSSWTNSSSLYVGNYGTGTLTIRNGGAVSNLLSYVGVLSGSTGTVTVDGAGSSWTTNSSFLEVGYRGTGTLTIRNGGAVSDNVGVLGGYAGSTGTATVDGSGSSWTNSGEFDVGHSGTGTLTIRNGGKVSSVFHGVVAFASGSTGTVTVDGTGSSWTNSGVLHVGVSGTGALTIQNGGAVNVTGSALFAENAGSAGTLNIGAGLGQAAVAPGTLNAASVTFGAGTGSIVFNHTASGYVFAPAISGAGAVTVEAGRTILTATNTYTGPTTVDGGILSVNGSIASSSLTTVNAGGTLGGNGVVGNTLIKGGTLAPGNSIGLLTVQGSLTFTAASTYLVEVSPADRTNVTGAATLGGATVSVAFAAGTQVNKQYTILNASGGVSGTFAQVNTNQPNFVSSLSYDANDVYLNLTLNFSPSGSNQQNVATALSNFFNASGSIPLAFGTLTPAGLSVASGELGTGVLQSSIKADNLFLNLLLDPTLAGRAGGFADPGGGVSRFAADEATLSYAARRPASGSEREAYAMATKAPLLSPRPTGRWSVWAAGYGGSETIGGSAPVGSQDTTARVAGGAAGADYHVSPDTLVGFALGGGGTSYSLANGSGSADLFQAAVYGRHAFGPAYVAAALAYGWHDVTTRRTVALAGIDTLEARFRADSFAGRFEGGYRFATPFVGIAPYAAVQAISFNLPSYAEQGLVGGGLFALNYAAQTTTDTRTELGLRTDKSLAMADGVLTLRGRLAWAHDYNPDRAVTAIFQSLPGASFVVNGARPDPDSALVSAGAEKKWLNGLSLAGTFEGEFSRNVTSYAGKGSVRYSW